MTSRPISINVARTSIPDDREIMTDIVVQISIAMKILYDTSRAHHLVLSDGVRSGLPTR